MENSTKILITGAILTAIVVIGGVANSKRLESKLRDLEEECVKMVLEFPDLGIACSEENFIRRYGSAVLAERLKESQPYQSVQLRIVQTEHAIQRSEKWWPLLAAGLLLLSALPWAWYFLLRRIRELRDAIVGNRGA